MARNFKHRHHRRRQDSNKYSFYLLSKFKFQQTFVYFLQETHYVIVQYVISGYVTTSVMICTYWLLFNVTTEREAERNKIIECVGIVQCAVSSKTRK
jgi:hypothetical protein